MGEYNFLLLSLHFQWLILEGVSPDPSSMWIHIPNMAHIKMWACVLEVDRKAGHLGPRLFQAIAFQALSRLTVLPCAHPRERQSENTYSVLLTYYHNFVPAAWRLTRYSLAAILESLPRLYLAI